MAEKNAERVCLMLLCLVALPITSDASNFTIDYNKDTFLKDGQPFRYVSGSLHYTRVHPDSWKDRMNKMRIGGLNAVQTYVPWNMHEISPGEFTFTGASDLPRFLSLAKESDLVVLLRMGPYICGEWEFGGFPAWLLTENKHMILRTTDQSYISRVDKWFTQLLKVIQPYLYENGGPIAMVQIENEYGSYFACDHYYMRFLYQKVRTTLGNNIIIYTTDGSSVDDVQCGSTEGAYATIDFGITDDPASKFKVQRQFEPHGPLVNSEFYTGWLDHWGQGHAHVDLIKFAKSLDKLLAYGANVNMYMYEGGTNFGYNNGANDPPYMPVPTSYDYDAPLNESGDITPKYLAIRDVISKYRELPPDPIPPISPKGNYGPQSMAFVSTVQDALSTLCPEGPITSLYPLSMEEVKHYYGFILYRHKLKKSVTSTLLMTSGVRDRGYVMVDQLPQGMLYREKVMEVNVSGTAGQYLDIFVENTGRVGFSTSMNFQTKGLIDNVTLDGEIVTGWEIYPIHLENMLLVKPTRSLPLVSSSTGLSTPSIYTGKVSFGGSTGPPLDTNLDMRPWVKGQAFVNDFNLGRYWPEEGPQVTLYVPASVFSPAGTNQISVLELEHSPCSRTNATLCSVTFTDVPFINAKPAGRSDVRA
ncbi:beta-galactosidase-like [Babylonia areolata]|uniref:beta-galactosidase-like n=1 Tax=Babylonia areolata TaxID=304850 RepID=UPI003FD39825